MIQNKNNPVHRPWEKEDDKELLKSQLITKRQSKYALPSIHSSNSTCSPKLLIRALLKLQITLPLTIRWRTKDSFMSLQLIIKYANISSMTLILKDRENTTTIR